MKPVWPGLVLVCSLCILNACGGASRAATSQPVAIHFSITSPGNAVAGSAFNITVTALDPSNNTVTTYSGTVRFTSSDAQAVLPAPARLTNGSGTFSVTLITPGAQTITAVGSISSLNTGTTNPITVLDSATHFSLSVPSKSTQGIAFNITVTALDAVNNVVTSYSGIIHFTSSDGKASLPPDSTLTNGSGTFPVTLNTLGGETITGTDTANASIAGTSSSITVGTAKPTHFSVNAPGIVSPGKAFNFTVSALDAANNVAPTYAGTVHFTSTDAQASLPANSTLTNGTGTFSATLNTAGNQTITATDTVNTSMSGVSNSISVFAITSGPPPNGTVGVGYGTFNNCARPAVSGFELTTNRGNGRFTRWSGSSLPPGLKIGEFTCPGVPPIPIPSTVWLLYGVPTQAGTFSNVVITVVNVSVTDSATYTITISSASAAAKSVDAQNTALQHHHYKLIDTGTFGGPLSGINEVGNYSPALNGRGHTVGFSANATSPTPTTNPTACFGPTISHGFEFQNGSVQDLGSLGGDAFCSDANSINELGDIQGISENGLLDPLLGFNQVRAVVWKNGQIKDLGTLGGNDSWSFGINNRGQVVGMALNDVPDPFSMFGFIILGSMNGTQTRAFVWNDKLGMQDLGTLGGDDAWAWAINERGQILGWSYTDSTANRSSGFPTLDPFFYDKGKMQDVGTLGGVVGFPIAFNNRGQVIGGSSTGANPAACWVPSHQSVEFGNPGCDPFLWENGKLVDLSTDIVGASAATTDGINDAGQIVGAATFASQPFDAYLWDKGIATDLGHLSGDCFSEGIGLNLRGQVVGNSFSCAGEPSQAFLWENGSMANLNSLIPSDSSLQLVFANAVNERGEIAGVGVPSHNSPAEVFNVGHAFLLIPCDENHPDVEGCDYSMVDAGSKLGVGQEARPSAPGLHYSPSDRNARFPALAVRHKEVTQ